MEIWETMAKKGVQYDETALNMYIAALQKSTDRKFTQEVERAKKLHKLLWKCLFGVYVLPMNSLVSFVNGFRE